MAGKQVKKINLIERIREGERGGVAGKQVKKINLIERIREGERGGGREASEEN